MLRIGIVGCGRILAAHLRGYQILRQAGFDDFRITALCARKRDDALMYVQRGAGPPQRPAVSQIPGDPLAIGDVYLSDFQDDVEVQVFTDYREMISSGPVDIINDFTTHALHHQVAEHAFRHQKHLLTQKPLAVSIAAARQMCASAAAQDLVFGVFENFRNAPQTRHLAWLFQSGRIGRPQLVLVGYGGVWWAPDRIVAETPWRHRLDEAGGITLDIGVHLFDQIRQVFGEPVSVCGQANVLEPTRVTRDATGRIVESMTCDADDTCLASVTFANGAVGQLFASWAGHGAPTKIGEGIVYYGTKGRVTGSDVQGDGWQANLPELYRAEAPPELQARDFPRGITDSFALNQGDFLEAVRQKRPPETSGWEGLRDLAASFAILESHQAGRRVDVAEVLSGQLREFQRPIDTRFGLL